MTREQKRQAAQAASAYYRAHQKEIVTGHLGEYVVVKDQQIIGYYETETQAFASMVGNELGTFIVQKCQEPGTDIVSYFKFSRDELSPVFNTVITNLKKRKEHLALRLNFEFGNISKAEYDKQEGAYLDEPCIIPEHELERRIRLLFTFSEVFMDAEEISEAFNCPIDLADKALQAVIARS